MVMLRGELMGANDRIRHSLEAEAAMQNKVEMIKAEVILHNTKRINAEKESLEARQGETQALKKVKEADLEVQALHAEVACVKDAAAKSIGEATVARKELGALQAKMLRDVKANNRRSSQMMQVRSPLASYYDTISV